jgi:hypothetical protein
MQTKGGIEMKDKKAFFILMALIVILGIATIILDILSKY